MATEQLTELQRQFQNQSSFADGYSPLYARLFGIVADWLAGGVPDPVVDWLLEASSGREPFDVTLLLMAALHREVLAGEPAVAKLARHYPTVDIAPTVCGRGSGGDEVIIPMSTPRHPGPPACHLPTALREAILARQEPLADFIRRANVQTNETGRGLAWLLPVACLGWPAIHLVELGASAGLNLVADRRAFKLVDAADPSRTLPALGDGPDQFTTLVRGTAEIPPLECCPTILSRIGGDMLPFHLNTADDELTLTSFIWADQTQRIHRLQEGIAALRDAASTAAPVRLYPLRLPDELPEFLARRLPERIDAPVVLFNTTVTMYLPDRGASLRAMIDRWAGGQSAPVLWLQWEPWWDGSEPPEKEWMAWTADFWPNNGRDELHTLHLAWVHPHGTALRWAIDWPKFLSITMQI